MGQARLVTTDAVDAMDELVTVQREVLADGIVTLTEQVRLNRATDDARGKVLFAHHRFRVVSLLTKDVQDVRNFETATAKAGIRNGLRLLDPITPLDAA